VTDAGVICATGLALRDRQECEVPVPVRGEDARGGAHVDGDAWFFEGLAGDDPHHVPDASERELKRRLGRVKARKRSRQDPAAGDQGLLFAIFEPEPEGGS
jgi:hypothetical protein